MTAAAGEKHRSPKLNQKRTSLRCELGSDSKDSAKRKRERKKSMCLEFFLPQWDDDFIFHFSFHVLTNSIAAMLHCNLRMFAGIC